GIEYLLLFQKRSRTWSFPKGHMEMCETEIQTAKREVFEEIGQRLRPHKNFRHTVTYKLAAPCRKTVVLFLAEAKDSNVVFESVMSEYRWLKCEEASRFFWNSQYKRILSDAERFIKRLG
ncbi:MAG: NUDIX domain-containing protein, partial [Clostridia bacterium]|nr:NUDIX domain-containing protein [Clostridia bacterium]